MPERRVFTLLLSLFALFYLFACSSYRIVGKVVDYELNEVANAKVTVKYRNNPDSLSVQTQMDGSFDISGIDDPNISIEVRAKNYNPKRLDLQLNNSEQFEQIQIEASPTRIIGQVLDSQSKEPLQNVVITILPNMVSILTGEKGRFVIENGLDPNQTNTLQFTKPNFNVNEQTVQPVRYQDSDLGEIYLTKILNQLSHASGSTEQLSESDIGVSVSVLNIPVDENTKLFLDQRDHFTKNEFAGKMREHNLSITDATIMENLNELVKLGILTVDEKGMYHTIKSEKKY